MKRVRLNSSKAVKRGSSTSIDSVGRGRGHGRGVTSSTMNNSSSSSQMQVDSVGVGESATPTPVPSMGGSQATEASTGEEEENHEMTEEEYLAYLKDNERYPILASIAKDILAIPVSTISSESSFSTSGRVINPHRSSLNPKMVQALICTQSWLRGETIALHHVPSSEEIELCEEAEKEILEMPSLSSRQNVKCGMLPPKMKVMKQTTLR